MMPIRVGNKSNKRRVRYLLNRISSHPRTGYGTASRHNVHHADAMVIERESVVLIASLKYTTPRIAMRSVPVPWISIGKTRLPSTDEKIATIEQPGVRG